MNDHRYISAELLGLSKVEVVKVTPDLSSYEIIIVVKSTEKEIPCRVCGKPTSANGFARRIRLRHLPLFDQNTYIEITPRRGKCNNCDDKPSTTEKMDWYDAKSKHTKAFEHRMLFDLVNSTISDVSNLSSG